jgi:hypothetical protein
MNGGYGFSKRAFAGMPGDDAVAPKAATDHLPRRGTGGWFSRLGALHDRSMTMALLRRVLAPLVAVIYLVAAMPTAPACAHAAAMNGSTTPSTSGDRSPPSPCNAIDHGGCTEFCLVCADAATLPQLARLTTTAWSCVRYDQMVPTLHGRTFAPALGPPISAA